MKCDNFRIQAQILEIPNESNQETTFKLLWINSYHPVDPLTIDYDGDELIEVLNMIESIIQKETFDDVLWGGDLNWHRSRNTGFSNLMEQFVTRVGLVSVWEHF